MTIKQPSADELIVSDFPIFTGGLNALFFVAFVCVCLQALAVHPFNPKKVIGPALGALVAGVGAAYCLKKSAIDFDRRTGQVTWCRWSLWGTQKGQIAFGEINDVIVEELSDSRKSTYRVALLTPGGHWPLTEYYSGNKSAAEKIKDRLRAFLGFPVQAAAVSLEERLRSLVTSGQTIEAIKLARLERNLSLKDAKEWVENLPRTA